MSRSKNTGEAIAFRLPTELDKIFREIAAKRGISPGNLGVEAAKMLIDSSTACADI